MGSKKQSEGKTKAQQRFPRFSFGFPRPQGAAQRWRAQGEEEKAPGKGSARPKHKEKSIRILGNPPTLESLEASRGVPKAGTEVAGSLVRDGIRVFGWQLF